MAMRDWFRPRTLEFTAAAALEPAPRFEIDLADVDPALFGLTVATTNIAPAARVARATAQQVPAVKRSRDLVCGPLATLPLELFGPDGNPSRSPLLEQPEHGIPRSVTMARTYEDLFYEGVAWWQIVEYGWHTYPTKVRRLDTRTVTVNREGRVYTTRQGHQGHVVEWLEDADLIRFDSPNDPLLVAGARAIRTCLALDAAAARYAEEPMPLGYFSPADGVDPAEDEDVTAILDAWTTARQTRVTGYVPAALKYNGVQFNAEQMQLADQRQHAVLEIARAAGVNPEDLGVSTTSRTYFNAFDKRKDFLDFTVGAYRQALEDRLSMTDVTPRGYTVRVNYDAFLRSDAKSRYEAYAAGKAVGALTDEDIARAEGKAVPATPTAPAEAPAEPAPVAPQE